MLSKFGHLLLVATAVAPVLLVYAAAIAFRLPARAVSLAVIALLLVVICHSLLKYMRRHGGTEAFQIEEVKAKDTEILSFLVAYMLPIILGEEIEANFLAILTFVVLMFIIFFRTEVYHVNPLMGLLGYHFYEVTTTSKITYLVVTNQKDPLRPDGIMAHRLSRTLLLLSEKH